MIAFHHEFKRGVCRLGDAERFEFHLAG